MIRTTCKLTSLKTHWVGAPTNLYSGIAVGLAGTFRLLGGAIATAIYTAILTNRYGEVLVSKIGQIASDHAFSQSAEQSLLAAAQVNTEAAYSQVPGITDGITASSQWAVKMSYVEGFKLVYLISIAFGGLATIAAFCTKNTDTRRKNNDRAVVLKNEVEAMGSEKTAGNTPA